MSRRKREAVAANVAARKGKQPGTETGWKKLASARHVWIAAVVLLLIGLGVAGAVSDKYKHSFLPGSESLNNAAPTQPQPPIQTGTPQLSKEYIYAGSRMLAVEDANTQLNASNSISGKFIYGITSATEAPRSVNKLYVELTGDPEPRTHITGQESSYQFSVTQGTNYTVTPQPKTTDVNGISTYDAAMVLRYVANNGQGDSALNANQLIAADANNSGGITPFDATLILRYIAANGSTPQTGDVGKWKFSPAFRNYPSFSGAFSGENFDSIIAGEINGDWVPPGKPRLTQAFYQNLQIYSENVTAASGSTILIPILFSNTSNQAVSSYSFQFTFDPWVLQPNFPVLSTSGTLTAGCQPSTNTGSSGMVGVSAYCPTPISAGSGTLLYLSFTVIGEADTPTGQTSLSFAYSDDGTNPLFEDSQGNRIGSMPGSGYFTVEAPPEAAANDSLSNQKSEDSSATVAGKAEAFVPPVEQQQQQQQQQQQPGTDEMQISLPQNAATTPGSTVSIPVTLTNSTGKQVSGFNFDVQYNPALVKPANVAIETTGTLSSKCEVVEYTVTRGRVKIVGACDKDITAQAGTLVKLRFTVTGQANNASAEARALKFRQIPIFENHKGKQIGVGRTNGSIR